MGEAKRRKQKLGEAYGKKQPPLNSYGLQEVHLDKFVKKATTVLDTIFSENLEDPKDENLKEYLENTQGELVNQLRAWLDEYLSGYEPQDREFLTSTHIGALFEIFDEATEMQKGNMAFTFPIVYQAYQPYLDPETAEVAAKLNTQMIDFHKMLMEEEELAED